IESRRLQRNLSRELEDRAVALIGILEASSKNAIASNALLEEAVAQRLLDNARFADFLIGRSPRAPELIQRMVVENKLAKVETLDPEGRPLSVPHVEMPAGAWTEGHSRGRGPGSTEGAGQSSEGSRQPGHGPGMMMGRMMRMPEESESPSPEGQPGQGQRGYGMMFMWGPRWWGGSRGDPALLFPSLPKGAKIRRFWEGSAFGIAVPAQSFSGIIAVHAAADYLLNFRREIGVERLIQDLGRQAGVAAVALLDRDLAVLASSNATEVGRRENDAFLREAWQGTAVTGRQLRLPDGRDVYEVVKPFALGNTQVGLLRLDLGTEGLAGVARQAQRGILYYSLGLLLVGIVGAVTIFWMQAHHLAERKALEAAMAQEQRLAAVGDLAAGVAHEVRNPLNAISIGLQRLRLEFAPSAPEARAEYLEFTKIMQAEVGRLNATVDRFLTLARPSRMTLSDEPLAPILEELLTLLAPQASAQKIQVVTDLALEGTQVRMNRQHLTQAFMNLFLNAIQAMPDGGTLALQAAVLPRTTSRRTEGQSSSRRFAKITVSDSGPGIAPELLERIFEPYFTTKEGGTGLGLALAHKIILEHGGSLDVENGGGKGATFAVELPIAEPASPAQTPR
ncbi:MAG TPA: ATP-binding protein, partial [Candidatus Methylomirabilis sp.]|nr:ATP-binding protein [Candidatus Methylomirabilis sp.]